MRANRGMVSRVRAVILAVGVVAVANAARGGVGQWTSSGPAGAAIYNLATSPSTPSRVFALSSEGLLRSNDGGASWVSVNAGIRNYYALTVAPSDSSRLYAISPDGKVARSEDEGLTWQSLDPHLTGFYEYPQSLAVDPSSGSTLYLGTTEKILKSSDGGLTWETPGGLSARVFQALAIDPSDHAIVYAAGNNPNAAFGDIFKSTDAGRHFIFTKTLADTVSCLAISPAPPTTIYGCSESGVIRSADGGATWDSLGGGRNALSIVIDPDPPNPSRIYVANADGLFRGNGNTDWSPLRFGPDAQEALLVAAMAIVSSSPNTLLVAGRGGLLRSTDGAGSWTFVDAGGRASIRSVAVNPSAPGSVYAGGEAGVFRSGNAGASWTTADLSSPVAFALAAPAMTAQTVFAAGSRVSKSTDGGAVWETKNLGFDPGANLIMRSVAVSPSDPSIMLAGTLYGTLFKSEDGGERWTATGPLPIEDAGYPPLLDSIAFDPSNPSIVYAAGDGFYGIGGGLFKTVDGGAHWVDVGVVTNGASTVVVDPRTPSTIYLATREGLMKSFDGGTTWISLHAPTGPIAIDPTSANTIYAAGLSRVFQSLDGGLSWVPLGREVVAGGTSLAIAPDGKHVYAGTPTGVFEYAFTGETNGPCTPSSDSLCLLGGRFQVNVTATDVRRNRTSSGLAVAQGDRFGYFSLPDFTGDATLPEVFIKMVDGSWLPNGSFWVFYNGLTSLPYTIVVSDTATGARRVYQNDGFCGGADTSAFAASRPTSESAIAASRSATTLSASGKELSLLGDRFRIALSATNPRNGRVTTGSAIPQGERFGYFSLPDFTGDPNFPEVCVKMIDATSFNGTFWFFHTGLTNLPYTLTVTDSVTGAVQTYQNGSSGASQFCGGADTRAFPK